MNDLFGAYQLRARVQPVLLASLPVAITAIAFGVDDLTVSRSLGAAVAFGVATVLVGFARDRGAALEARLWASWGGPPTTTRLLSTSAEQSEDRHVHRAHVARLVPDGPPLSDQLDQDDPVAAKQAIERYVAHLRERTRDRVRFPVVFDANVGYGFRRNVLGLKFVGGLVAAVSGVCALVGAVVEIAASDTKTAAALGVAGCFNLASVIAWSRVNGAWVETQARRYASALLNAAEALEVRS